MVDTVKQMPESRFQSKVMQHLKNTFNGEPAFFWKASDRFIAGIPDIMGVYRGLAWGIELKVGKNKTTSLQELTIAKLRYAGALCFVCYTMDDINLAIAEIRKRKAIDMI